MIVIRCPNTDITAEDIRTYLSELVPKWWVPEEIVFVEEIPHTATGKISKKDLRVIFQGYAAGS